jgi:hypothetical protein
LHTAPRPHREMKEEKVLTCVVQPSQPSSLRRSNRSNLGQTPNRLIEDRSDHVNLETGHSGRGDVDAAANLANIIEANPEGQSPSLACPSSVSRDMNYAFLVADQPGFTAIYEINGTTQPCAFKASHSDPDTLSYDEAMADVDRELWIKAAKKEIKSLEDQGTWTEVDISEATSKFCPLNGCFAASALQMEMSSPSKDEPWQEEIWNRESFKPSLQSSLGAQFDSS